MSCVRRIKEVEDNYRIVRVWVNDDYLELEIEVHEEEYTEDELYETVVNYVYNNISIEVI